MQPSMHQDTLGSDSLSQHPRVQHEAIIKSEEPGEKDIQQKPWKYIGYKGYSSFITSEDDFFILRRFDTLNVRVALALQDELSGLEEELEALDNEFSERAAGDYNNDEFLIQQHTLRKLPVAPRRDVKSLRNWHHNHDYRAIEKEEQKYLDHEEDLVAMAQKEKTPLRQVIDGSLRLRTLSLWRHREESVATYDKKEVTYYSDKRMNNFASAVIIAIGVLILITPIWILQALTDLKAKLAVITVFIFVFLLVLSLAMVAKPFEALGATAAYAAVLMVFLQIQSEGP
ncbi:hypothetical protein CaCOL14_001492 [Colletotrichum acutatum]